MVDEKMTLLERDVEAKAPTRLITGHKDLLSSRDACIQAMRKSVRELDESVRNAIQIRQMQQTEFVAAVYHKCSRHQEVPQVGASRPCQATCEQADDPSEATIQFHS